MKQNLLKEGWKQRIVRIRPEYIKLCAYLEFLSCRDDEDSHMFFDNVFDYSLNYISMQGFHYEIDVYQPQRKPKGFLLSPRINTTFNEFHIFYNKLFKKRYGRKLLIAEFVELILYIYAVNHLKDSEIEAIGIDFGIHRIS